MEINTVIEVMGWIESTYKVTVETMVSEKKLNPKEILKRYCEERGIPHPDSGEGVPYNMLDEMPVDLIKYLTGLGFKPLKGYEISFSD